MSALPEGAKVVMRRHQYVRKFTDDVSDDEADEADEEDSDFTDGSASDESPSAPPVKLGQFLAPVVGERSDTEAPIEQFESVTASLECADSLIAEMLGGRDVRQRCTNLIPVLVSYTDQVQSEQVLMRLLETIDALIARVR
jgi:hypothetical protein